MCIRDRTGHYIRGTQQGASTINQQLIKNITDDDESQGTAGYLRKIREIFRAMSLNSRYSKEMIMEAYLNTLSPVSYTHLKQEVRPANCTNRQREVIQK